MKNYYELMQEIAKDIDNICKANIFDNVKYWSKKINMMY